MKYLKSYEENINEPQIGDYVICKDASSSATSALVNFLLENIGKIVNYGNFQGIYFLIEYQNIPSKLDWFFKWDINGKLISPKTSNYRKMAASEIIFFSPNKGDCDAFMATKKYNM